MTKCTCGERRKGEPHHTYCPRRQPRAGRVPTLSDRERDKAARIRVGHDGIRDQVVRARSLSASDRDALALTMRVQIDAALSTFLTLTDI